MTDPLRVTVVASAGVVGGAELWLLSLLDATDRLAVDAVLLAEGPLEAEFAHRGVPHVVRPTGRTTPAIAATGAWLARRLRAARPDVVLANGVKAAVVTAPAARLAGVRCLWAKHDHSFDGPPMRLLAAATDGCVATEQGLVRASHDPRAVLVPVPAPDGPALSPAAARAELGRHGVRVDADELLLLTAGRLVPYKGVDDAITALARPGGERWRLAVVGGNDPAAPGERQRLAELAAALGVGHRVDFAGWIRDAWRIVPAADAVAVLTKPDPTGPGQEAFAGTAVEAMLAGVPVITTPGSITERVTGPAGPAESAGPAGISVRPADPAEVAGALRRLTDPDTRAAMGRAGRQRTAAAPGPAVCAAKLAQALSEAARLPGTGLVGTAPVSVVTTVLDEGPAVDRLLRRLLPQLTVAGDEIVVVDGGSADDTAARARAGAARDPRIRVHVVPGAGISAGRNAGVREARNDLIACTDAGCAPDAHWLARLRAAAAEPDPAALLTGVYRVGGDGVLSGAMAVVGYPVPEEARHPGPWTRLYCRLLGRGFEADMPTGRSMAFTREAWRDAGGFPEGLRTGEDVLFGRAVTAAGHQAVLVAGAEVDWEQRPTLRGTAVMYFRYGDGGGRAADARLLGRDVLRAAGYAAAGSLAARGPRGRAVAAAGAACYLSVPLARAVRTRRWASLPAVPVAAAVRDLAKVAGAAHGLAGRVRSGPAAVRGAGGRSAGGHVTGGQETAGRETGGPESAGRASAGRAPGDRGTGSRTAGAGTRRSRAARSRASRPRTDGAS
ncbi:glycosyltransferase [Kitasatospora sp. NPDC127111]|uniref:glycosyltransferase n=1 Tax=Kitasatospora sp. NPDC127111 TaxID=3345363 RepID=UPI00362B46E2